MVKQDFIRACVRRNRPINFLVVDDSDVAHKILSHRFKMLNWTMVSLFNGQEAVKFYQETGFENIDIVLMDKSMPVMNGLVATTKLIQMGCETPIVALTASAESLDEFVARGALGAVTKPLQIPNLISSMLRIRSLKVEAARNKMSSSTARSERPCAWMQIEDSAFTGSRQVKSVMSLLLLCIHIKYCKYNITHTHTHTHTIVAVFVCLCVILYLQYLMCIHNNNTVQVLVTIQWDWKTISTTVIDPSWVRSRGEHECYILWIYQHIIFVLTIMSWYIHRIYFYNH